MSQSIYTSSYSTAMPAYNHNDNHNYNGNGYHNSTLQETATTLYHSPFSSSASTISGGVTTYETQQRLTGIRRAIIEPDDPTLRPGYDPEDPFYTPVGDTLFPLLLCAVCYILIRLKKTKNQ